MIIPPYEIEIKVKTTETKENWEDLPVIIETDWTLLEYHLNNLRNNLQNIKEFRWNYKGVDQGHYTE